MNILICGDSFAADWQVKHPDQQGWPNMLAKQHSVVNLAQAGVGEYKILQQVKSADLNKFDSIVIAHTSPNRVHCTHHPVHSNDVLHKNADLIYKDVVYHQGNPDADVAVKYFEKYFDLDYYSDVANLICAEILNILGEYPHLNQFHMENYTEQSKYLCLPSYNFNPIFSKHHGLMNHFSDQGNRMMLDVVTDWLKTVE